MAENEKLRNEETQWQTMSANEVLDVWQSSSEEGLSKFESEQRRDTYGLNKLPEPPSDTLLKIFLTQFKSPLIYLLLVAALIILALGEYTDAGIIFFLLVFNSIIGTVQANKAQNTLLALKNFSQTQATILRNGEEIIVSDVEVVPGDIIILQEGEKVPADARILEAKNFSVNEAALTGESDSVKKQVDIIVGKKISIGDKRNMIFKGTNVISGNARAVVVSTGLNTYIGDISIKIGQIRKEIPLQRDIKKLSHIIIRVVLFLAVVIFFYGIFSGETAHDMFKLSVAVIVSAIPEGLPIVLTLLLATGVWRMGKRNVLIKQLQAVEGLGQAQVVAVDKTGTITKNELVVQNIYSRGSEYEVSGVGYEPEGDVKKDGNILLDPQNDQALMRAIELGVFNSNARLNYNKENKEWQIAGDPTEAALLVLAKKIGISKVDIISEFPQLDEIPFDSKNKYHAVLHEIKKSNLLVLLGAPEVVLKRCTHYYEGNEKKEMTSDAMKDLEDKFLRMSEDGIRVLGFASKESSIEKINEDDLNDLVFEGIFGMRDALRSEVRRSVMQAGQAGIKVVMITGDFKTTAVAIAKRAGIYREGDEVMEGYMLDDLTDEELSEKIGSVTVFARFSPDHKFRIVNAYKARKETIAMTGDGVNDALSLVAADLGMAMGRMGTEVAKEAADLVLLDDNFSSIISAIEEGRSIYKGIRKVLLFLFSTNLGEIMVIVGALFFGLPLPILAAQIIWLNFVTDGFLVATLAMDPKEKGLLRGRFKKPSKWVIDKFMLQRMLLMSSVMAVGTLLLFVYFNPTESSDSYAKAITVAVTAMASFEWFRVWSCRSDRLSIFQMSFFNNWYLLGAFFFTIALHYFAVNTPIMQEILSFVPLSFNEWIMILWLALTVVLVDELWKLGRYVVEKRRKKMKKYDHFV